jgi:hypothetical protein
LSDFFEIAFILKSGAKKKEGKAIDLNIIVMEIHEKWL